MWPSQHKLMLMEYRAVAVSNVINTDNANDNTISAFELNSEYKNMINELDRVQLKYILKQFGIKYKRDTSNSDLKNKLIEFGIRISMKATKEKNKELWGYLSIIGAGSTWFVNGTLKSFSINSNQTAIAAGVGILILLGGVSLVSKWLKNMKIKNAKEKAREMLEELKVELSKNRQENKYKYDTEKERCSNVYVPLLSIFSICEDYGCKRKEGKCVPSDRFKLQYKPAKNK